MTPYPNENVLIKDVRKELQKAYKIGVKESCGFGTIDLLHKVGIPAKNILNWDIHEPVHGGLFKEITQVVNFINCIYLSKSIPPLIHFDLLNREDRDLSTMVDVSADTTNPHNPFQYIISLQFSTNQP